MTVSRRAWVTEALRAVAMAATGFIGLLGLRASRAMPAKDRVLRVPSAGADQVAIVDDAVIVRRSGRVRAFSLRCPHLGCRLAVDSDGNGLTCPCHGSRFDLDGNRVAGPAPRGLRELDVELTPT